MLQAFNGAAQQEQIALNAEIAAKIDQMATVIASKTAAIDDMVENLTEDFIIVFWETVEEIYELVNYYERQGLIWKALYQKKQFLQSITVIRDELIAGLAEVRAGLTS